MIDSFVKFYLTEALADYIPEFFEFLKNQPDDSLVHFTNWFRVGYNKNPPHQDPIGVYTFPKKYVLSPTFKNNSHFFGMNYAFILRPKGGRILNLSKVSLQEVKNMIQKMGLPVQPDESGQGHHSIKMGYSTKPGHLLWDAMEKSLEKMQIFGQQKNVQWNKWFKAIGVDALVDDGDAIIHHNEPFQVVFLTPGTYQEVTYFQHSVGKSYRTVAHKIMDSVGKKLFDNGTYKMNVRKKKGFDRENAIYLSGSYKGQPLQLWSVYYEGERDKLDQPLRMKISFASHLSNKSTYFEPNSDENRIEVSFDPDKPDIEQQVDKIVNVFKAKLDEPGFFRESKSRFCEALIKKAMSVLGLNGEPEKESNRDSYDFSKKLKGFGTLHISASYFENSYDEEEGAYYSLIMALKSDKTDSYSRAPHLYGNDKARIAAHYVEEGHIDLAVSRLIRKTLTYWKEMQEKLYPTDYNKYPGNDWNSSEKMKTGEKWIKFFAWVEDKLAK